jgi:hypothetical protein
MSIENHSGMSLTGETEKLEGNFVAVLLYLGAGLAQAV